MTKKTNLLETTPVKIYRRYGERYPAKGVDTGSESFVQQSSKDECDINVILRKYRNNGTLPDRIRDNPQYGDFAAPGDYHHAMNVVAVAHEQFQALGAEVRERFANDPRNFLAFAADPRNVREMISLGLATEVVEETVPQPGEAVKTAPRKKSKESERAPSKKETPET